MSNIDTDLNKEKNIIKNDSNEQEKIEKNPNEINENKNIININDNNNENKKDEKEEKNNYISEIKKYLNNDEQHKEYTNIIANNPDILFELINDRTIMFWQSVVYSYEATIINSDTDILTVAPERKDQQIIINDSKRTRYREASLVPGFKKILEEIITFYTNTKNIVYKQGLNEIFGPLILIKYKMKKLRLVNIFNLGEAFIDRFLPNYYYEKDIYSLKSSISLFVLLLKYHEPSVFNYLDSIEIPHELYAANWLLTLRSQKFTLDMLYSFWDILIRVNDPLFIHFILVALIKYKRDLLLHCDSNLLLKLMVGLTMSNKEELDLVAKIALELRNNTPYSFRLLANKIGFLKTNNKNIQKNFELYNPESIPTMQIFPIEILNSNYANKILCPDPECINNSKNVDMKVEWEKQKFFNGNKNAHICEKCDMNIEKNFNYVILDLRLFPQNYFTDEDDFFKMGVISGMMSIEKEELKSDNIDKLLSSRLLSLRGKNHIVLMTSKTDYFFDFEKKFYSDETSALMKKKMLFGVIEAQKSEKKLNLEDAEKNLDLKEIYKLKEYDTLRRIMTSMKNNNFPYVSYLEGGYEALHNESIKYKIELVAHEKKKCKLCQKKRKESKEEIEFKKLNDDQKLLSISDTLWKNQKVITEKDLSSFFSNENNVVLICVLRQFKNKFFHQKDNELFIAILFDKKVIEIYKNDTKKEKEEEMNKKDEANYYNLGMRGNERKNNLILRFFDEIKFEDIKKASYDDKYKNIVNLKVVDKDKDKENGNNKNILYYKVEFEFHSIEDSKSFINSLKKMKNQDNFYIFSKK